MLNSLPTTPVVVWTTHNGSTTIPSHLLPQPTVTNHSYQHTPDDVASYLYKMGFYKHAATTGDMWSRSAKTGYMTWEQAVVYCLIKPWLDTCEGEVQGEANA